MATLVEIPMVTVRTAVEEAFVSEGQVGSEDGVWRCGLWFQVDGADLGF